MVSATRCTLPNLPSESRSCRCPGTNLHGTDTIYISGSFCRDLSLINSQARGRCVGGLNWWSFWVVGLVPSCSWWLKRLVGDMGWDSYASYFSLGRCICLNNRMKYLFISGCGVLRGGENRRFLIPLSSWPANDFLEATSFFSFPCSWGFGDVISNLFVKNKERPALYELPETQGTTFVQYYIPPMYNDSEMYDVRFSC